MKERVMRWGLCLFLLFSKEGKSTFFNDLLDLSDQPYRSLLMSELCSVLKRAANLDSFSKEESILDDLTPELLEKAFMDAYSLNPDQNSWTLFTYPQNWLGKPFSKLVSKIGWGGQIYCPAPGYLIPRTEFHIESVALRQEVLSCLEPLINAGVNPFSVVSKQDYEKERCLGSQSPWYGVTQHFGVHLRKEGGQPPLFITSSLVQCIFLLLETDKEYFVAHLDIFTTLKQLQSDLKSFWGNRKSQIYLFSSFFSQRLLDVYQVLQKEISSHIHVQIPTETLKEGPVMTFSPTGYRVYCANKNGVQAYCGFQYLGVDLAQRKLFIFQAHDPEIIQLQAIDNAVAWGEKNPEALKGPLKVPYIQAIVDTYIHQKNVSLFQLDQTLDHYPFITSPLKVFEETNASAYHYPAKSLTFQGLDGMVQNIKELYPQENSLTYKAFKKILKPKHVMEFMLCAPMVYAHRTQDFMQELFIWWRKSKTTGERIILEKDPQEGTLYTYIFSNDFFNKVQPAFCNFGNKAQTLFEVDEQETSVVEKSLSQIYIAVLQGYAVQHKRFDPKCMTVLTNGLYNCVFMIAVKENKLFSCHIDDYMDLESLKKPLKDLFEENATVQILLLSSYYSILLREVYDYLTQWGYVNLSFQVPEYRRAMGPLYKRYSRGCELVMRHLDQPTQGPKNFGNICVDWQARKITVLSQDDPHIVQMNSLTRWMFDQEEEVIEGPLIFPCHIKRGEMVKGLVNQDEFPYGRRPVKMMEMDSV